MNPQETILTTIPYSNRENNCDIFDSFRRTSNLVYRISTWNGTMKSESENIVENLRGKIISNILSAKTISKLKSWAQKFYNLEPHQLNFKLKSKIFQFDSC